MRLLFEIDAKNYQKDWTSFVRNSARSIIIRERKVAMVHSSKYDYYKFPGGGIEKGESPVDALIRETAEEAGLVILPESVREYGYVHRIQKSDHRDAEIFVQDNLYYLCEAKSRTVRQFLDDYEEEECFVLEWVDPRVAIDGNRNKKHGGKAPVMLER